MGDTSVCFMCNKSHGKIILFSEKTLRKCQTALKVRIKHNLKYKDNILPDDYTNNGYHRECYKHFTSLMKKYLFSEPKKSINNSDKQKIASVSTDNSSTTSSLIPILKTEPFHLQSFSTESSNLTFTSDSLGPQATTSREYIVKCEQDVSENNDSIQDHLTVKEVNNINYENVCVFCDKKRKHKKSKQLPLHKADINQFKSSLLPNIEGRQEFRDLLNKLKTICSPQILYHKHCRLSLNNKLLSYKKPYYKSDWHFHRDYHQLAFNEISAIIEEEIIEKGRCYLLVHLLRIYTDVLEEIFNENSIEVKSVFTARHLEQKILKQFSKDIKFFPNRNKKIVAPKYLQALDDTIIKNLETENTLQKAATILRKSILQIEKNTLPTKNIKAEHSERDVSIPPQLLDFYKTLLGGCREERKDNLKYSQQVLSYCQDVMFAVHKGHVTTPKHIMLAITLKNLTGRREVVDVVNRYGHCISYKEIEELETEETYTTFEKPSLYPEMIKRDPELLNNVADDDFDCLEETASDKDPLHDALGIKDEDDMHEELGESDETMRNNEILPHAIAKRRPLEARSIEEIPYDKKPKMKSELLSTR